MTTTFTFETAGAPAPTLPDADPVVLEKNTQHVAEGISNLIEFFRHGPRNQAILTALLSQVQEAEDAAWQLYTERTLDVAEGAQLDVLGRIVGELRNDRDDEDFRAALRVRILVNASDGKPEQLIAIALGIAPDAAVQLDEVFPGSISLVMSETGGATLQTAFRLLDQATAAGVRLELTVGEPTVGAEDADPLGGTIGAEDDDPLGFTIAGGT